MSRPPRRAGASASEQLTKLESHVRQRMEELEPFVEEYRELEQIAARLGIIDRARAGSGNGHVAPGERHGQLSALIRERPGITVREAGSVLDVDPTSLYRIVRRLVADGEVEKRGRELYPLTGS